VAKNTHRERRTQKTVTTQTRVQTNPAAAKVPCSEEGSS
jgi:hypothetical protein